MLNELKNIIIILSGKGGVGKSTFTVQLGLGLQESGRKVSLTFHFQIISIYNFICN